MERGSMIQSVASTSAVVVGLGEYHVTKDPSLELVCLGIGSCIAFAAYDRLSGVAALAHFVLPEGAGRTTPTSQARFVDSGLPLVLQEIRNAGAIASRIVFKIAGGSQMTVARGFESRLNIGERNAEAVEQAMSERKLSISSADTGGSQGRTIRLQVSTGRLTVSKVGGAPYEV
jgi:chemotaxis protein CheD